MYPISSFAITISSALLIGLSACTSISHTSKQTIFTRPLLESDRSWNGTPLTYPTGRPCISGTYIELAPGAETGWHVHPVPVFGYLLEGHLEVHLENGSIKKIGPQESLVEVVGIRHNGKNIGNIPVKIIVFYAGADGIKTTVKHENVSIVGDTPGCHQEDTKLTL